MLLEESENGNVTGVEVILRQCHGTNINIQEGYDPYRTPLMLASKNGHANVVEKLLSENGINVNKYNDYDGKTALHLASMEGNSDVVRVLLQHEDIDINMETEPMDEMDDFRTALHYAAINRHVEVVQMLIEEEEIDVNKADLDGDMAIHIAAREGYADIAQLLLTKERIEINQENDYDKTPLVIVSCLGNSEIVKLLLLQNDIDVNHANSGGQTAIHCASSEGRFEVVAMLLQWPEIEVNQEFDGETALWTASKKNHNKIVQLLLEYPKTNITRGILAGNDINNSMIKIANLIFDEEVFDLNETHEMIVASLLGNYSLVATLLETKKSAVNTIDSFRRTPLFWASTRGHFYTTKLLLSQNEIHTNIGKSSNNATAFY